MIQKVFWTANELFIYNSIIDANGKGTTKYPTDLGITSEVLKTKKIYWTNSGKFDSKFNSIVDNATNGPDAQNFFALPLFSINGSISGIVHLINKSTGNITLIDEVYFT